MEGLEVSVVKLTKLRDIETFRFDSDYFSRKYIEQHNLIDKKKDRFIYFKDLNINVDASAFYPSLEPYYNTGSIPFIRVADVNDFIDYNNCVRIPEFIIKDETFKTLKAISEGDIVITKGGSIGRVALIDRYTVVTRDLIFINSSKLNKRDYIFLYLYLKSDFAYSLMVQSSSMTAQPHLTLTLIKDLPIFKSSTQFKDKVGLLYNDIIIFRKKSQSLYTEAEQLLLEELGLKDWEPSGESINSKSFKNSFLSAGRLDAEYYQPKYDEIENIILSQKYFKLSDYFDILSNPSPSEYIENGIKVIKTKNIRIPSVDYGSIIDCTTESKLYIQENDLLFASMGVGSLGRISFIDKTPVEKATIDGTIKLFRQKEASKKNELEIPTLLFLSSKVGQELIYKYIIGSTGIISISKENLENLIIPIQEENIRRKLSDMVLSSISLKQQSEHLLEVAKRAVEIAIEENEKVAMDYIKANESQI